MKKSLIGLMVVACFVCASAVAGDVPHQPVTACPNGTNPLMTPYGADATSTTAGSLPIFSLGTGTNYDNPVTSWPTAGNWDMCAAFDTAACSLGALSSLSTDILTYQSLFYCSTDINGPLNLDPEADLPVTPNGIPDGNFELGLLAAVMNTTSNSNNAAVVAAFKDNFNFFKVLVTSALANIPMKMDARPLVPGLAPYLPSGLVMILAAFATEGDDTSIAALDTLMGLLGEIGVTPPAGSVADYTTGFPTLLGPTGDADGDGYTNKQEYNYFKNQGAAITIAAELDPAIFPPATVPKVIVLGSGTYEVGGALELTGVALNCTALTYQWSKNGTPLAPETASALVIPVLAATDAGSYVCSITYDDGSKAITTVESNPALVTVVPAGSLPIAGGLGLALLAGACALGGVGSIRRRK